MIVRRLIFPILICALACAAQTFDNSGAGNLHGDYFVREVLISGQNADGTIGSAKSVIGVATFDGKGNYTFNGQSAVSSSPAVATNLSASGTYEAAANGFLVMTSLADSSDNCYGGISALGPAAFVASATEGSNVDILIAIPAGSNASNATLKGSYAAAFIDLPNADITMARQGSFTATSDGAGNLGSVAVSGTAANVGGAPTTQTVNGVTYSLSGEGAGNISFGAAGSSQLIAGAKTFYVSADGNIVLAGNPAGFDLMVGIRALGAPASNASWNGVYYVAAMENFVAAPQPGGLPIPAIDGFYGSTVANGQGASITHNRFQSFTQTAFDYTYDSQYQVPANGTFAPADTGYQFTLGAGGQAFLATGAPGSQGQLYSLMVGFGAPKYSGIGVYLNPLGIVNAANFAPITNPVAPNELVTLFGSGFSSGTASATSIPLPAMLGGVQVTVNGQPVPLFSVAPGQIVAQAPSSLGPTNNVYLATFQVVNNGTASNPVTVYAADSAPGVFTATSNGIGPAVAQHADYSLINAASPAKTGETVVFYATGLGAVTPAVAAGAAAGSNPVSSVNDPVLVDLSGQQENVAFSGLTPGLAGLYQVNTAIVSSPAGGSVYVNVSTNDGYTSQATIPVVGATGAIVRTVIALRPRPGLAQAPAVKSAGLHARAAR